ncbi:hypothetical protein AHAS_Ahas08G0046900 [Arachis hypogaea]
MNASWVKEFYDNYYSGDLNVVHLRGKMIFVTEEAIEHALHFQPGLSGKDAFEVAESEKKMKTFDWDRVLAMIAKLESQWIFGSDKTTPQGIFVCSLTNE